MTKEQLKEWWAYQEGTPEQVRACIAVRTAMYHAAETFRAAVPVGPGQHHALLRCKAALQAMIGEIVAPAPKPGA